MGKVCLNMNYKTIYDKAFQSTSYNVSDVTNDPTYKTLMKFLREHEVRTMVDVGSGKGFMEEPIMRDFPQIQITTIDLQKYHRLEIPHINLDITSETKWSHDTHYDFLLCNGVLEHIEQENLYDIVRWFAAICEHAIIMTANHSDIVGGTELHITRQQLPFWDALFESHFNILDTLNRDDIWYVHTLQTRSVHV